MIDYNNILFNRSLDLLKPDRYNQAIEYAKIADYDLSPICDDDLWLKELAFLFPLADLLKIYDTPYYSYNIDALNVAAVALRLSALIRSKGHPYIQACHMLQTASLASIVGDDKFTNKWLCDLKVSNTIPKGHYQNKTLHYFYQLSYHTIIYLLDCKINSINHITVLAKQINNYVDFFIISDLKIDIHEFEYLVGLAVWSKFLVEVRKNIDINTMVQYLDDLNKIMKNDLYFAPSLSWIRAAFSAKLQGVVAAH